MPEPELLKNSLTARYVTLFGGEAVSKLAVLAAFAYLARILPPREFGLIELSLSVTLLFSLATECGFGSYGARIVAAVPERAPSLIPRVMIVRSVLAVISCASIAWLSERYGMPGLGVLAIYGLSVLGAPFFVQWVMQGLGRMRWVAVATVVRNMTFVAILFALVRPGSDIRLVAVAEVGGVAAVAMFNLVVLTRVLKVRLDWRGALTGAGRLFHDAWPVGASDLMWAALWYSPGVLLGAQVRSEDVAWLAAPVRIVLALHTFVFLYFFNLLPGFSKAAIEGADVWRQLARRSAGTSMWLACLAALVVTLLAPWMITTIYGPSYVPAILPLRIVIWLIPITWLSGHFRYTLIATGRQRLEFASAAGAVIVMMTVALMTIPSLRSVGAALALIAGGLANLVLAAIALEKSLGTGHVLRAIVPAAAACAPCLALGLLTQRFAGELAGVLAGSVPYLLTALKLDGELTRLRQVWLRV